MPVAVWKKLFGCVASALFIFYFFCFLQIKYPKAAPAANIATCIKVIFFISIILFNKYS
jgi:Na+-transporting NADH:ubiquinone oxidoreductase subunit NqrB